MESFMVCWHLFESVGVSVSGLRGRFLVSGSFRSQGSISALCPGDEPVQDLVRYSVRLRLGRHPAGLHSGKLAWTGLNPAVRGGATFSNTCPSSGRHSGRLHLFLRLSDWSAVPGPRPGPPRSWPGPVRPSLHPTSVLLLLRLAEGNNSKNWI